MPAYNAEKTLKKTYNEIPLSYISGILLVDDNSTDATVSVAKSLGIKTIVHHKNIGYGGNQKTCYKEALRMGADIVVMLHPDYQYTPKLIPALVTPIAAGVYDSMIASRILGKGAIEGGMPKYKYICNRILTFVQNILVKQKLSEYHTGYRAYSREILETLPLDENSDDFIFDNEVLCQIIYAGFKIGEVSCPTSYADDASSINFRRSCKYGLGVLRCSLQSFLHRMNICKFPLLSSVDRQTKKSS